jgi:hypothetical protein
MATIQIQKSHTRAHRGWEGENTKRLVASPVDMRIDPLGICWMWREGYAFPVAVPAGENPDWSQERIWNAWRKSQTNGAPPPLPKFYHQWLDSCQEIASQKYKTGGVQEWDAILRAAEQKTARQNNQQEQTEDNEL